MLAMKSLQWPILVLILIIAVCAIAFTALKRASDLWYGAFYTFTALLLLSAVIAARFRRGSEKAFWFGFAVFGWAFFVLGLGPWPSVNVDDPTDNSGISLNPHLLTSRVILYLVPYLRLQTDDVAQIDKITTNTMGIAHLLITLAIAPIGGTLAIVIRRRRGRLVSARTLTVVAALAVLTAAGSSITFGRQSARHSRVLAFSNDPSLKALAKENPSATAYQLTWTPTFHHAVRVRIDWKDDGATLRARVLDGKAGYEPGQVAIDKQVFLGPDQVKELDRHLKEAAFWTMPTEEKMDGGVEDGDTLFLEGVKRGTYHAVTRRLPGPAYTKLCRHMLDLTGLKIEVFAEYHSNDDQAEM
jgi:hypothetical protein